MKFALFQIYFRWNYDFLTFLPKFGRQKLSRNEPDVLYFLQFVSVSSEIIMFSMVLGCPDRKKVHLNSCLLHEKRSKWKRVTQLLTWIMWRTFETIQWHKKLQKVFKRPWLINCSNMDLYFESSSRTKGD